MKHSEAHTPVVRLHGVSKEYVSHGNVYTALVDVDLSASRGEMHLALGPSGSGKTTLLTIAAGFVAPTAGVVELFGRNIGGYSAGDIQQLRARKIGFIFQTFLLIEALNVAENVDLQLRFAGIGYPAARRRTQDALASVGIAHLARKRPSEISHGERQRVAIARALANDAELIIADEPTASLGRQQGEDLIRLLHSCATVSNTCVIVASHDQRLREYADSIHTMDSGRLSSSSLKLESQRPLPG